jgi:glyoxylase-like metal-dependent hydrolase (beta-lactamase superfamily II)
MTQTQNLPAAARVGALLVVPFAHPQGCRTYLLADPRSRQALVLDVHLDLVDAVATRVREERWTLPYVVDSHTHADHPSGAGALAERFKSTRIAHARAQHAGVARHPDDGDSLHLGDRVVRVRHAPGHTPDHIVLVTDGALFAGDTLLIGGVARTDFLGGDAGQLFDSVHRLLEDLADDTVLYPGHDYAGRIQSTIGEQRRSNPWLQITDRAEFVRQLTANPPPRPANMDDLLRLNREGVDIPATMSASEAVRRVAAGGATSVIDVRTGAEYEAEHVKGSRWVPLDEIGARADEVRAAPAPRLLLCRSGTRAGMARKTLAGLHVGGLIVVEGGIEAFRTAGGATEKGRVTISLERQVRIAAGSLAGIGVLLGAFVHPAFLALAGFVAAGLVFAGITDQCGMGMLLARMPWNRRTPAAASGGGACAANAPSACAASAPSACAAQPPER